MRKKKTQQQQQRDKGNERKTKKNVYIESTLSVDVVWKYDEDETKYYPIFDGKFFVMIKMGLSFIRGDRERENRFMSLETKCI